MNFLIRFLRLPLMVGIVMALSSSPVLATHYMGVDIAYECLDSCNYRIFHTTYYDCTGSLMISLGYVPLPPGGVGGNPPPPPSNFDLQFLESTPGCGLPTAINNWTVDTTFGSVGYLDVTPVCPTLTTGCETTNNPDVPGVVGVRYVRDYNFCNVLCDDITIQWDNCCRNNTITGINNPSSQSIYVDNLVIDFLNAPCNSSPRFQEPPVPYLCAGQSFTFNQGVFDPDGDSLRFFLGPCLDFTNAPVPYQTGAGFSATTPMGPNWDVNVDSLTGDITITPNPTGPTMVALLCVYVEEYDRVTGTLIGETVRDMQITVIDCGVNGNIFPTVDSLVNLSPPANIQNDDFEVTICACELACWDLPGTDPDTGQNHVLFWSQNLPGGYMTYPQTPNVIADTLSYVDGDSLIGRFCWIPQEVGFFTTTFTYRDDGCPILGQNQYSVKIRVVTCSLDPIVTPRRTDCYKVEFAGLPCGGGADDVTYEWSGDAGLTGTNRTFEYDFGGPGTYTYTLTIRDSLGQTASVTDSITLFNTAAANAGSDNSLCSFDVQTIGTPAQFGYSYQWSSPLGVGWNGQSNPSGAQPEVVYINNSQIPVTIPYYVRATDAVGCEAFDTVNITYDPVIPNNFFVAASVCADEPATIQYSSPLIPGASYQWDYDGAIGTLNGPGPHTIVWNTPGVKSVKLNVAANGCLSDTGRFDVTVFEKPTSEFIVTSNTCQNETVAVTYAGSADPLTANLSWDFGDGVAVQTIGGYEVTWATPGVKTIKLTVEDNGCISDESVRIINVIPTPSASFFIQDSLCLQDIAQTTYVGSNSTAASYDWEFGGATVVNGSGIGPYQLQWPLAGDKDVCLTVRESGCVSQRICQVVHVSDVPDLDIAPVVNQCFTGNSFDFTTTGDVADSYLWDFGAGAFPRFAQTASPTGISYSTSGVKTVTLIAADNGCGGDTVSTTFEVIEEPTADFQASALQLCSNDRLDLTYLGTSSGPTQTFTWDFGNGAIPATSSTVSPSGISYTSGGTKNVSLTVSYKGCTVTSTQPIQINASPIVDAGNAKEFCEGDGGVELDGFVTNGAQPYFFTWSCEAGSGCGIDSVNTMNPLVNPQVTNPTETVVYYFEVADALGCASGRDSVVVTVKAKPKLDAGVDASVCPPDAPGYVLQGALRADNNAPLPIAYTWSPAIGLSNPNELNPTARPDSTTIYTLTGVSSNGCTSQATTIDPRSSVTLTVKPKPTVEAGVDTGICVNESIELSAFAQGAGPNYTYTWTPALPGTIDDPSSPSPTVSPNATTTYTLVVSSDGCSAADSVTITVDAKPTVSAGGDRDICKFEVITLDGKADGDPNATLYNYTWSPAIGLTDSTSATPDASPSTNTTYTVIARTDAGCESDPETISLNVLATPEVDLLQGDTIVCAGQPLPLVAQHFYAGPNAEATTYSWTPQETVTPFIGDSLVTAFPTTTGYISVTASSFGGRCATTEEILVEVTPAISVNIEADTNRICSGDAIELRAIGGLGSPFYEWLPAADLDNNRIQNPIATPSMTTNYQVILSEGACKDTADYLVDVTSTPQADYRVDIDKGCGELTVSFNSNSPDAQSFIWDFKDGSPLTNEANPVHTFSEPGSYAVSLTTVGENQCQTTAEVFTIVVAPLPEADFMSTPAINTALPLPESRVVFTDMSRDAVSWLWDFGDGGVSTDQNPEYTYTEAGEYRVSLTITDANGCVSTIEYGVFTIFEPSLFVPTVFTPNGDGSNDEFIVSYDGTEEFSVYVMDRWGRRVFESLTPGASWDGMYNGTAVAEGTYYYAVRVGQKVTKGNLTLLR
ncbi:MAG: PKD domain-containing protein [Bacteroidota bacterium]